ncbi:MAG: MOSC domain-containing protein [Solirubrobacterales bacterium]|nr:MOSC domain-containing protein [Solirubrobacterales bacterium]
MTGRVLSLQVGAAATVPWRGRRVPSAIVKKPVAGRIGLSATGFAGDEQADLTVHGGPDKAVCCFAREHQLALGEELQHRFDPGAFGENLTIEGLADAAVHIGDTYTLGGAVVQVSQPRGPCFKVAARWGMRTLPRLLSHGLRSGWYLRVLDEGDVGAGDALELVERVSAVSVAEVTRVTYRDRAHAAALEAILAVPELAAQWRDALLVLRERQRLPLGDPVQD